MASTVEIKTFELNVEPIPFKLNVGSQDVYYAVPDLPLSLMQHLGKFRNITKDPENFDQEQLFEIFDELLTEPSAELLRQRAAERKFGVKAMMTVLPWLIEQYGLRPTQPSSLSSTGLSDGETGTSSTAGAPAEESTLSAYQDTVL